MTPTDKQLPTLAGFPAGINNQELENSLPVDENGNQTSLRQAVNVDLDHHGKPSRRDGYTQITAGDAHSGFTGPQGMFAVLGGDLKLYDANLAATTVIAGLGDNPVSFVNVAGETCWTNETRIGRIDASGVSKPVWIDAPGQPIVTAYASGDMTAGVYQVVLTWLDAGGRESGASLATLVTLTEGQGIRLSSIPTNPDATTCRAYVTPPDGDGLHWAADFATGITTYVIGNTPRGKLLATQWLEPMPPGQFIREYNGMLLVASENILWISETHRYGLKRYDSYIRYHGRISLLEPVGEADASGVYLCVQDAAKPTTYFYSGASAAEWKQARRPYGAIEGTAKVAPGHVFRDAAEGFDKVVYWINDKGHPVIGLPSGKINHLTDERFVTPTAERGATLFRDQPGLRQMISSLQGSASSAGIADFATAEVRRNGVVIP